MIISKYFYINDYDNVMIPIAFYVNVPTLLLSAWYLEDIDLRRFRVSAES